MDNTIVVGVTGADVTSRALDWAVQRAVARGQRLELLSVVGGALGAVGEIAVVEDALAATSAMLEPLAGAVRAQAPTLEVTTRVDAGNPVAVLIEASRKASLLVIGSDYAGRARAPPGRAARACAIDVGSPGLLR
jgi:nucleotide-binding universal stress UspA family protein